MSQSSSPKDLLSIEVLDPIKTPLVTRFYKSHYPSGKAKKNEHILVGYLDKTLVAVVRFREIDGFRLLTGMLVDPAYQGKGLGHALLKHCENNELTSKDYCFAYSHLESFYAQHGFQALESDDLPNSLKNLYLRYMGSGKSLTAMQFNPHNQPLE